MIDAILPRLPVEVRWNIFRCPNGSISFVKPELLNVSVQCNGTSKQDVSGARGMLKSGGQSWTLQNRNLISKCRNLRSTW